MGGYPKLGLWWPDASTQAIASIARYDWVSLFEGSHNAALRAANPAIVLLRSDPTFNAREAHLDPSLGSSGANAVMAACSPRWLLTQAGTSLSGAVDASTTTFPVAATNNSAGALFKVGEPAVIGDEVVLVTAIGTGSITVQRGLVWGAASGDSYGRGAAAHTSGTRIAACVSAWTNTVSMDVTSYCPSVNVGFGSQTWAQFMVARHVALLADGDTWDGLFVDACDSNCGAVIGNGARSVDLARTNAVPSSYDATYTAWNNGIRAELTALRSAIGTAVLVCNQPVPLSGVVNGFSSEGWPDDSWSPSTWKLVFIGPRHADDDAHASLTEWHGLAAQPDMTTTYSMGLGAPQDQRLLRFGLCSALINGDYFAASVDTGHAQHGLVWADEYDNAGKAKGYLGQPGAGPISLASGAWRRDYDNGIVLVNPTAATVTISLEVACSKIAGTLDASVNDGSAVAQVDIPAHDGVVLLKTTPGAVNPVPFVSAGHGHQLHILDTDDLVVGSATSALSGDALTLYDDLHSEDLTTGGDFYEFEVAADNALAAQVRAENQVVFRDLDGEHRIMRIKRTKETLGSDDSLRLHAECECGAYELNGIPVRPSSWNGAAPEVILEDLLSGTRWSVGDVDYTGVMLDHEVKDYPGTWKAIQDLRAAFSMEVRARCELTSGRITGRFIDLLQRRGSDTGKRFEYGKDIKSLAATEDSYGLATALLPLGAADASGVFLTISPVSAPDKPGGQDWIGDDDARMLYGRPLPDGTRGHVMVSKTYSDIHDPDDLLAAARVDLEKMKAAALTLEMDPLLLDALGMTWEAVRVGDGVYIIDPRTGVQVLQRITALKRSYVDLTRSGV